MLWCYKMLLRNKVLYVCVADADDVRKYAWQLRLQRTVQEQQATATLWYGRQNIPLKMRHTASPQVWEKASQSEITWSLLRRWVCLAGVTRFALLSENFSSTGPECLTRKCYVYFTLPPLDRV